MTMQIERQNFFEECAASYPHALVAMSEFLNHVQEKCKRVMEKHIMEFAEVMAVELDRSSIIRYSDPSQLAKIPPKLNYAQIGVRARRQGNLSVGCCLLWDLDGNPPSTNMQVYVSIWVNRAEVNKNFYRELEQIFKKAPQGEPPWTLEQGEGGCPVLGRNLSSEQLKSFDEELDRLVLFSLTLLRGTENVSRHFRIEQAATEAKAANLLAQE